MSKGEFKAFQDSSVKVGILQEMMKRHGGFEFKGIVRSGIGEGRYYLSQHTYLRAFKSKLGFEPFPGTLNLELSKEWLWVRSYIIENGERVEGYREGGKEFGGVRFCRGSLRGIPVGVLVPEKTVHQNVVEIVAEKNLRESLRLSDGDEVWVRIS
jgi:riboflavin kinase